MKERRKVEKEGRRKEKNYLFICLLIDDSIMKAN